MEGESEEHRSQLETGEAGEKAQSEISELIGSYRSSGCVIMLGQ